MLLIYTHKITPRFTYIMRHIFVRLLGVDIGFTTTIEEFIAHTGPKITYTKQPLQKEFFIRSHALLFQQGFQDVDIQVQNWHTTPCFFAAGEKSSIPFDIFAASFYLLSRYEEYAPHVKDMHNRYPATESIAYKHDFLELPVVDIWVLYLKKALQQRFPAMIFAPKDYKQTSIIDVPVAYAYLKKGLLRTIGATVVDVFSLQFKKIAERYLVLLGLKKDPFDVFDWLISMHKQYHANAIYFFLVAPYSAYDKGISIHKNKFKTLLKSVADYSIVSLMTSYESFDNPIRLKQEKKVLRQVLNRSVKKMRQRYNRVQIPETYRQGIAAEFTTDYTMGYTHYPGFRAGSCSSFYFYDIGLEMQLPILLTPFCLHDVGMQQISHHGYTQKIDAFKTQLKQIDGHFVVVFSNTILGGSYTRSWKERYLYFLK